MGVNIRIKFLLFKVLNPGWWSSASLDNTFESLFCYYTNENKYEKNCLNCSFFSDKNIHFSIVLFIPIVSFAGIPL